MRKDLSGDAVLERLSDDHTKKGRLQRAALSLLQEHRDSGSLPTSVRFLYYEAVQRGVTSKHRTGARRSDQDFGDAVTYLRKKGIVPWGWIVDETRDVTEWSYAATVADYVVEAVTDARIDCWDGRPPPLILCESRSLAGVLEATVGEYLCPIASTNGQVGGFLMTVIAPMLRRSRGRRVLYLGDFDHQGHQIEANTRRYLEKFARIRWERRALTEEQVRAHDLEAVALDKEDRRYVPPRIHVAIETEALRQDIIVSIVRDRLDELLPAPLGDVLEREDAQRDGVRELLDRVASLPTDTLLAAIERIEDDDE